MDTSSDWMSTARRMWLWAVAILVDFPIGGVHRGCRRAWKNRRGTSVAAAWWSVTDLGGDVVGLLQDR